MSEQTNGFDWSTLWTRLFVVVVMVSLAVSLYTVFRIRDEIADRRYAFCVSTNDANTKQRALWEAVIAESRNNDEKAWVLVGQKRFPVVFEEETDEEQLRRFRAVVADIFPVGKCDRGALNPGPTSRPTP
jgi:hypothetical protein